MNLQNPFPPHVRSLYMFVFACFNCTRSDKGLELHHIFGRVSSAAFNAIPLCRVCHAAVTNSHEERSHFFFLNIEYLLHQQYQPTQNDFDLITVYPYLVETARFKQIFGGVDMASTKNPEIGI